MSALQEASNDDISNLLARLGLPRHRWYVTHSTNIDTPSVVVLNRIAPQVRDALKQYEFTCMEALSTPLMSSLVQSGQRRR